MLQRMLRFFTTSINYYDGASFGVIVDCRFKSCRRNRKEDGEPNSNGTGSGNSGHQTVCFVLIQLDSVWLFLSDVPVVGPSRLGS